MIEATAITDQLYVGSAPSPGHLHGFDVLVLCAREYQPEAKAFPGVEVAHAPFDDRARLSKQELLVPVGAARKVARRIREGKRVLVTCQMGRNRSAFVAALALHFVTGRPGIQCANRVRTRRRDILGVKALENQGFFGALAKLPGK